MKNPALEFALNPDTWFIILMWSRFKSQTIAEYSYDYYAFGRRTLTGSPVGTTFFAHCLN